MSPRILSADLIRAVDDYVRSELSDARKYENREPFDESGVWSLHNLAAEIYAAGWAAGGHAEMLRNDGQRSRERDAAKQ